MSECADCLVALTTLSATSFEADAALLDAFETLSTAFLAAEDVFFVAFFADVFAFFVALWTFIAALAAAMIFLALDVAIPPASNVFCDALESPWTVVIFIAFNFFIVAGPIPAIDSSPEFALSSVIPHQPLHGELPF